jgi:multidrug resistance efflux pump
MRRLGHEEEELEDTVSHLSIYLTVLDKLYHETAAQLKEQIRRAEGAEKALIVQTEKVVKAVEKAESDQRAYEGLWQAFTKAREEARQAKEQAARARADLQSLINSSGTKNGWISEEEEPMETHWDKGTQTEDVKLVQDLPPKKRRIQTEEESP